MSGQLRVGRRTRRLETVRQRAEVFALARRLAAELGITAEEFLAEARTLQQRMHAVGAVTRDHQLAFLAAEDGIPEDELRAELARIRAAP